MTVTSQEQETSDTAQALSEWKKKRESRRRRRNEEEKDDTDDLMQFQNAVSGRSNNNNSNNNNNNEPAVVVTLAKRRKMEQEALLLSSMEQDGSDRKSVAQRRKQAYQALQGQKATTTNADSDNSGDYENDKGGLNKRESSVAHDRSDAGGKDQSGDNEEQDEEAQEGQVESLLDKAAALQKSLTVQERAEVQRKEEENRILREASQVQTNALQAASEIAGGIIYKESMPTSWTVPKYILDQGEAAWQAVRDEWHMEVEGPDIPPPLKRFIDMKFPKPITDFLKEKGIKKPTPIQMQGLPVALAGRDMVGIAFTGSGKTLTFALPMVMAALEEEFRMPILPGEGPVGIILAPSRELARQTYDTVHEFCEIISNSPGFPGLRSQLLIGGESAREQLQIIQGQGVHCIVATPGRLRDLLKRKQMNLRICRYICLDEADRMLDLGFDEEVGEIMNYFPHQRQTLLFSATFPKKFQDFARQTLVKPIVVNVGRAGAANLDVIQEVEYVKQEAKIVYLLHCLQKTAPPVIIFCERKGDVDDIHEYLLLKGVEAVSIHGGKDQEERNEAIKLFKEGKKDILIATDIAAKGLDFAEIQHVINFDMPTEIENYVHRIGRTGRCGKTGVATTYINKSCEETTLLDLKALLREARQRIPPVLMMLDDPREKNGGAGCSFCGGLGHTIVSSVELFTYLIPSNDALTSSSIVHTRSIAPKLIKMLDALREVTKMSLLRVVVTGSYISRRTGLDFIGLNNFKYYATCYFIF
jgi:ATP-dependent RNA helicase DDX41